MNALSRTLRYLALALLLAAVPPFFATEAGATSFMKDPVAAEKVAAVQAAGPATVTVAPDMVQENKTATPVVTPDAHTAKPHAEAAEGHDGEHHASNPLAWSKLEDLFWRTINFIALLIILVKFLGKPILNSLGTRQERIAGELADLTARRDEAEKTYREFSAKIADMEKDMERVIRQAVTQAQHEKERILAEAERAAEDIRRQAEASVQGEIEAAKRQLREEVAEEATKMAEELIRQNLTEADQVAITEQYLERVGAAQ